MRLVTLFWLALALGAEDKAPLLVFLDPSPRDAWERLAAARGWRFLATSLPPSDPAMKSLESQVREAIGRFGADPERVYLAGQGNGVPAVFLAASRLPGLWTAALAIGGNVRPAVNSNRLFGANTQLIPLLWYTDTPSDDPSRRRLAAAEFNLEVRPAQGATAEQALDWLATHRRDLYPASVDCETGSPAFPRCYWLEITGFDPRKRNDVLGTTRVNPGSGATLNLGAFGFDAAAPGPGVEIVWLPPDYAGPLKLHDRIVSVGGKAIADAREYMAIMDQTFEEKAAAIVVLRGNQRQRIEARIVLPERQEPITARVQGTWLTASREIQIISRAVSKLKADVPAAWTPVSINWNGIEVAKAAAAGCWELSMETDPPVARRCEASK